MTAEGRFPILLPVPPDCDPAAAPAKRALDAEGLYPPVWALSADPTHYARALAAMWREHRGGFVLVEYDICPWPGALDAMWDCPEPLCMHLYPLSSGRLGGTLGCVKFGRELVAHAPLLCKAWEGVPWRRLDHAVIAAVADCMAPGLRAHVHEPAVAHARVRRR